MKLSQSLTDINVMVTLASALKDVELDKMTFLQVPSRGGLPAPYSGRVAPNYEQANVLFELLRNDQPLIIDAANTGSGAVVDETASPTASATPKPSTSASASASSSASATPSPSPTALPEWARGTNASVTTCSS
jgi:hypothetical protein